MIVSVSGYGSSGSSAVVDLLKEYTEVDCPHENELDILYVPGGIISLDDSLNNITARFFQSDYALTSFKKIIDHSLDKRNTYKAFTNGKFYDIATEYFNKICVCKWKGMASYDHYFNYKSVIFFRYAIVRRLENIFGEKIDKILKTSYYRDMYLSIKPENFLENTRQFMEKIIQAGNFKEDKIKIINQLIPGNYANNCLKYIKEECKVIIVARDPRDTYLNCKYISKHRISYIPNDVNTFIKYYKQMICEKEKNSNILYINFEDLIYKYDETVKKIEKFLGINNHVAIKEHFKPELSIANTLLFKRLNHKDEVDLIEKELADYLYDFPTYEIDYSVQPFCQHDKW